MVFRGSHLLGKQCYNYHRSQSCLIKRCTLPLQQRAGDHAVVAVPIRYNWESSLNQGHGQIRSFSSTSYAASSTTTPPRDCNIKYPESALKLGNPDTDYDSMVKIWWALHQHVILHSIQGGHQFDHEDADASTTALSQFELEQVYAPDAEYHDLFIIAKGRAAVRCSFQLISLFWRIKLTDIGEIQVLKETDQRHQIEQKTKDQEPSPVVVVARVPFRVAQHLKLLPNLVQSEYNGWVDLHLRYLDNNYEENKAKGKANPIFVVERHDDRMAMDSSSTPGGSKDALTWALSIPVVGAGFQVFRRAHGRIVEFLSRDRKSVV